MNDTLHATKSACSVVLLTTSIVLVCALIFGEQTSLSQHGHPVLAFIMLWACLVWLSMVEGGQAAMVGLPPIDRKLYKTSHPTSHAICEYGHRGDNLDRFLMGRQFMVLALVFVINLAGAPVVKDGIVLGLPTVLTDVFLRSGLAMMLITSIIGQLTTQINASHCMLDYIDTHFMTFTLYAALGIEASGLLHASYMIQIIVAHLAGKPIESNEPPRRGLANFLFWARVVMSLVLLTFALVVTGVALFTGRTTMYKGVPPLVAMVLTLSLWSVIGMLEGMQIAFFAVSKRSAKERNASPWTQRTCDLLFKGDGRNLPGFMVGRQLCVVSCFFLVARATTMDIGEGDDNVLRVPDSVQQFFNTGLLGALSTTIVASIASQLVASAFPLAFLSTPVTYYLLRFCLLLESTGICNAAWILAGVHKKIAHYQKDEAYFGTAEDRAVGNFITGGGAAFRTPTGHLNGGAFPAGKDLPIPNEWEQPIIARRSQVLSNIRTLYELIGLSETEAEKEIYRRSLARDVAALGRLDKEHGKTAVAYMKQMRSSFFLHGR